MKKNNITINNIKKIRNLLNNLFKEFGVEAKCEKNCVLSCWDNKTSKRVSTIRNKLVSEYDTLVSVTAYFDIEDNGGDLVSLLMDDKTYDNIINSYGYIQLTAIIDFDTNRTTNIEIRNLRNNKSYTVTLIDIIEMLNNYEEINKVLKELGIEKYDNEGYFEIDENTEKYEVLENIASALYNIDTASLIFIYLKLMLQEGNKHE